MVKKDKIRDGWHALWQNYRNNRGFVALTSLIAAGSILAIRSLGGLQLLELRAFDKMVTLRPYESLDPRLVIVGLTDADLDNYLGSATISDQIMADVIRTVRSHEPRVIGLDFYRNLPSKPGDQDLAMVFQETPNLIGIEKVIEDESSNTIPGNTILKAADRTAASDIVVDTDGRVRRALLFPSTNMPLPVEGFGLRIALDYLAGEALAITPNRHATVLTLNQARFPPIEKHTGGYVDVDAGGYQLLLNLRQQQQAFEFVSFKQLLQDQIPPDMMRDRIVLIGNMALSSSDIFYTASRYDQGKSPIKFGVEIHGEIASQIISHVLDGRPLIYAWPRWMESILIIAIATSGGYLTQRATKLWQRLTFIPLASLLLLVSSYGALSILGLWIPIVPMVLGLWLASGLTGAHRTAQLQVLSANDKLTGLANRRTFDETLQQMWFKALRSQQTLTLLMGDVDHFKKYNDTYGHPQGDECLRRVAQAIRTSVRAKDALSARYGGEEFVVLLPNTSETDGIAIANAILAKLKEYALPHSSSETADHVTMSLGMTSFIPTLEIPPSALVDMADLGLYTAKKSGRNRVQMHRPDTLNKVL